MILGYASFTGGWREPEGHDPFRKIYVYGDEAEAAEDRTLSASVSFCDGNGGTEDPDDGSGTPVVSGDSNDDKGGNGGGSTPMASDDAEAATSGDATRLPATGGLLLAAGVIGALLLAGWGVIARRFTR